jgi:CDP-2,3-bis-(O-geranylgeranyl)-sn-glycerol synthase
MFQDVDFQFILKTVCMTVWLLLPAYTPNNFAVVFGGGKPMDFGRNFIDGKRILGNGKTVRGFIAGIFGGILVGHLQLLIENVLNFELYSSIEYSSFLTLVIALAFGAMTGDVVGSFIKRRTGFERGQSFPLLDQLGFLAFALLFASFFTGFKILFKFQIIIAAFIITPALHLLTNYIAYRLGLKDVPW